MILCFVVIETEYKLRDQAWWLRPIIPTTWKEWGKRIENSWSSWAISMRFCLKIKNIMFMLSAISSRLTSCGPLPPIVRSSYWGIIIETHKDDLSLPQNTWPFTFSFSSKIPTLYRIDFSHSCLASVLLVCLGYFLHLPHLESCHPYKRWRPVCYRAKVIRPIKTHLRYKPGGLRWP